MKDRIKEFIDYKGISAGELAEMLDVQRSNISHILNGRNKPGAVFLERFLLSFPEINARWLLTGKGKMIGGNNTETLISSKVSDDDIHSAASGTSTIKNPYIDDGVIKVILLHSDGSFSSYIPK